MSVPVLFCRSDSNYKLLPGCDVWDQERDATNWPGGLPLIAHPPCRAWGRLRSFSNPLPGELDLARWSVDQVRLFGGVIEHPSQSLLWKDKKLPLPGSSVLYDDFGGWTLPISQMWWGHRAQKNTWLYICGLNPSNIPSMPLQLGHASHVVQSRKSYLSRPHISKAEREHTPIDLCKWLVDLASRIKPGQSVLSV